MKPLDFPLLADENISPSIVDGLRVRGCDVRTVSEERLIGRPDGDVLVCAVAQSRIVVTHDLAFGRSAIHADAPFVGIIYIRPGHVSSNFVLDVIDTVRASALELEPPFLIVAERRETVVRVRFRAQPPW